LFRKFLVPLIFLQVVTLLHVPLQLSEDHFVVSQLEINLVFR
jgi:hypothetical protein